MALKIKKVSEPTLLVDLKKVERNIERMLLKCTDHRLILQPHFKTHQSAKIGSLFRQKGVKSITVSSLKMASYFSKNGWSNIHIAMPPIKSQYNSFSELVQSAKISVNISCSAHIEALAGLEKIEVCIDLDPGYGRTGVSISNFEKVKMLQQEIENAGLKFKGFYLHNGATYLGWQEILDLHEEAIKGLKELRNELSYTGDILFGDTPGCSLANNFNGITHITAGNFVFYDLMQESLGSCFESQIAVCMACPIIEKHSSLNQFVLHGGAVHFSKDSMLGNSGKTIYGKMVHLIPNGWGNINHNCELISISQEHGKLKVTNEIFNKYKVGDTIGILPVHSCLTADSMGQFTSFDGERFDMMTS